MRGMDWFREIEFLVIGAIGVLAVWLGIRSLGKFGAFLEIKRERPGWRERGDWRKKKFLSAPQDDRPTIPGRLNLPKHEPKVMMIAFVKFLIFLFIMVVITTFLMYGIFLTPPVIIIWVYIMVIVRKYIILWKAHGYSALLFVGVSLVTIALSAILSPFIRILFFTITGLSH